MTLARRESSMLSIVQHAHQLRDLGAMLVSSGFLPRDVNTPEKAVVIILKGRELGLEPMAALNGITVIQGKPTVSPQLMLSLINASGLLEDLKIESTDQGASVTMKRRGRTPHTERFGPREAQAMQLSGKDNYKKQPGTMYKWRAVAACARVVFPDVIDGLYTPEEMGAEVTVNDDGDMEVLEASATPMEVVAVPVRALEAEQPTANRTLVQNGDRPLNETQAHSLHARLGAIFADTAYKSTDQKEWASKQLKRFVTSFTELTLQEAFDLASEARRLTGKTEAA